MKLIYFLLAVVPLAIAADPPTTDKTACKCALVKCVSTQPEVCINSDLRCNPQLHSLDDLFQIHVSRSIIILTPYLHSLALSM